MDRKWKGIYIKWTANGEASNGQKMEWTANGCNVTGRRRRSVFKYKKRYPVFSLIHMVFSIGAEKLCKRVFKPPSSFHIAL
eukprot:scaffold9097_cov38-Cyclotella_meneghiniana.AAC.1